MGTGSVELACVADSVVCLCNGSLKLVLISRRFAEIIVSFSDWLDSYVFCEWTFAYTTDHVILRIAKNNDQLLIKCCLKTKMVGLKIS